MSLVIYVAFNFTMVFKTTEKLKTMQNDVFTTGNRGIPWSLTVVISLLIFLIVMERRFHEI